jgi:DNA repair protein RecO (recombination protein O)
MEWIDEGIVLGTRKHGEANAIVEVMTHGHGRHLGLVRGGASSRLRPMLQPGNVVRVVWRARLDEHLGHYQVEPLHLYGASQLTASHAVYGITHLAALCRLLPERDPHPELHDRLAEMLGLFGDPLVLATAMVRFELQMLAWKTAPRPERGVISASSRRNRDVRCRGRPPSPGRTGCSSCRRFCRRTSRHRSKTSPTASG